jgi:hypothetical protein
MIDLLKNWPVGEPVPAISLMQPWASAVADYGKDVENRKRRPFKHRGPIVIHASRTRPYAEDFQLFLKLAKENGSSEEDLVGIINPDSSYSPETFPHGCIVAVANLVDVFSRTNPPPEDHPMNESPWKFADAGSWLYLTDVTSVKDVDSKGFVGLFKVPYEIASKLEPFSDTT